MNLYNTYILAKEMVVSDPDCFLGMRLGNKHTRISETLAVIVLEIELNTPTIQP